VAYVFGFPVVWYVITIAVYHTIWAIGVLPTNGSGLPTFLGAELTFFICCPAPFAWLAVIVLAFMGRLPGQENRRRRGPGRCEWCGYFIADLAPPGTSIPCPECGEIGRVPVARDFEPICPPGTVPGGEPAHYPDDRLRQG
jgi:hypothetical protein